MLLRPPPFADPDRLVILFNTSVTPRDGLQSAALVDAEHHRAASAWRRRSRASARSPAAVDAERPRRSGARRRRNGLARLFSDAARDADRRPSLQRRRNSVAGAEPVASSAARLWKRKFGSDPGILGATIIVNDVPLTVVGILPEGFAGLSGKAELWIPPPMAARLYYSEYLTTPQNFISVVARLKDGVSLQQASAELSAIGPALHRQRIRARHRVERGGGAAAGSARRSDASAIGSRAARGRSLRAADRLRQRRQPAPRASTCAPARDRGAAGDRLRAAPPGSAAAHRGPGDGRRRWTCGTVLAWWGVGVFARTAPEVIASARKAVESVTK